jgi:uncharacterized protein (TIGR03435 family)
MLAGVAVVCMPRCYAQLPDLSKFEVASIRPSVPPPGALRCVRQKSTDAGRVTRTCSSLKELLVGDAGFHESRLVGPDWMDVGQKFDFVAKLPDGGSVDQLPEMFRSLLKDRFGLTFHTELREQPVYALEVAKGGTKARPAAPPAEQPAWVAEAANNPDPGRVFVAGEWGRSIVAHSPDGATMSVIQNPSMGFVWRWVQRPPGIIHYEAPSISFQGLAGLVSLAANLSDTIVVDGTRLEGRYEVKLDVPTADIPQRGAADGSDLAPYKDAYVRVMQDALKKLGLELKQRKEPVEMIVIDHLNKAPTQE